MTWMTLGLALLLGRTALAGAPLIGYVNVARAVVEVNEGKRAQKRLRAAVEKKQAALGEKKKALDKIKAAIDRESVVKDSAETRARMADFQTKVAALQQDFMKEQQSLQQDERKALEGITKKMRSVIAEIGKKGGYALILEGGESRLLFAKPHLDLTNEVIRSYNAKHK